MDQRQDITGLLRRAEGGDAAAHDQLLPLIYDDLKRVARAERRHGDDQTLNTTALVHETYLRLVGTENLAWPDRHRFYAYAARAMRSILIDRARHHMAKRRGGDLQQVDADEVLQEPVTEPSVDLLELDQALSTIADLDPRLVEVVELHVFAGLEFSEIAQCLGIAERTVYRIWQKAKALLQGLMKAP